MYRIAILASGSGTNAENIAKYFNGGETAEVALVISNRAKAGVLARMDALGVPTAVVANAVWDNHPEEIVEILRSHAIDLVVLAGFMHYVSPVIIDAFPGRILNIHPSLLPAYGGKGMFGHHVHEAVVNARETESGVTVHYVTSEVDKGEVLMQEKVSLLPDDTPETLEAKIHPIEYSIYPRAIEKALSRLTPPPVPETDARWAERLGVHDARKEARETPENVQEENTPEFLYTPKTSAASKRLLSDGEPMPPTYLVPSVLATVFCCIPFGVVGIYFASKVSGKYFMGDIEGAKSCSRKAGIWTAVAFSVGITFGVVYGIISAILAL